MNMNFREFQNYFLNNNNIDKSKSNESNTNIEENETNKTDQNEQNQNKKENAFDFKSYDISKNIYYKNIKIIRKSENSDFFIKENIREYNLDFNLKLLYSKSTATSELANSKVSNYLEFMAIKSYKLIFENQLIEIPTNKTEILNSDSLDLMEKQKLYNFLMAINSFAETHDNLNNIDDFKKVVEVDNNYSKLLKENLSKKCIEFIDKDCSFNEKIKAIIFNVLSCENKDVLSELTVNELVQSILKYMNSVNVFSKSPFLYPLYGGSEFSQAMCRLGSIYGGVYIINPHLKMNLFKVGDLFYLNVDDLENQDKFCINSKLLVMNESFYGNVPIENIEVSITKLKTRYKYIWFYVIDNKETNKEGPNYTKIPKNSFNNNSIAFDVIELFSNTNSCSAKRELVIVRFITDDNYKDDKSIEEIDNITYDISQNYISCHYTNESEIEILYYVGIRHEVDDSLATVENCCFVTKNNFDSIDLDLYFKEAEIFIKNHKFDIAEIKETETHIMQGNSDIKNEEDNLLDELLGFVDPSDVI